MNNHPIKLWNATDDTVEDATLNIVSTPNQEAGVAGSWGYIRHVGVDFWECFVALRQQLEPKGWRFLCAGARKDAMLSGMARDMSGGLVVYLGKDAKQTTRALDPAPQELVGTVEEQREFQRAVVEAQHAPSELSRYRGCLLGLAAGDALGTTVEFRPPGTFAPLSEIVGGGPFNLRRGEWTDDTSMALCLAESLVTVPGFDPADQMQRYLKWRDDGYMSSNGRCFDIGNTVNQALSSFTKTQNPYSGSADPSTAGNGAIMRLAPIPMFFADNPDQMLQFAVESSRTTHGAKECLDACQLLSLVLHRALKATGRLELFRDLPTHLGWGPRVSQLAAGHYMAKTTEMLSSTGYVIDTLEVALYCFRTTSSFSEAVCKAANLGGDADTAAAVCGQIAGAFYGEEGIPWEWRRVIAKAEMIGSLAERLCKEKAVGADMVPNA